MNVEYPDRLCTGNLYEDQEFVYMAKTYCQLKFFTGEIYVHAATT